MRISYQEFLAVLAIDLFAILVLTYALYFRRHQRRDLTLGLVGINLGLFAVSSFSATTSISIGFGIGLFALLSVIRLRSTVASQEEIGYYFVALVIGLVNGLAGEDRWGVAITLNVMLLAVMYVADHPRVLPHSQRCMVVLKGGTHSPGSLKADLEDRLGFEVTRVIVLEINYAHHFTNVDVRFRTDRPVARRAKAHAAQDEVPDVVSDDMPGATPDGIGPGMVEP